MMQKSFLFMRLSAIGCCLLLLAGGARVEAQQPSGNGSGGYAAPYLQADFLQTLSEWASPLVNPALMYRVDQKHLDFGLYRFGVGDEGLGYQQLGFIYPYLRNHSFGLSLIWSSNTIDHTRTDNAGNILNNIFFSSAFTDLWVIPSYSIRVLPSLMLGVNAKYRYQKRFDQPGVLSSPMPGLDLGVYYNPLDNYRDAIGDLGFSLTLQDVVPTQIDWKSSKELSVTRARTGVRWAGFNDNVVADAEMVVDNGLIGLFKALKATDYLNMFRTDSAGTMVEALDALKPTYHGGFHVKAMFVPQIWLKAGWTNNNIPYVGFNYNLIYLIPEVINYVNFDYNLGYSFIERSSALPDQRGFTMATKLGTDFGMTREQILSKRLYDKLILAPMDAYQEAMRLYLAGKYWEAQFAFGKVLALFPNFHLNDKVHWYLGDCYTKLYMNDIARETYKQALEEYTTSEMRAKYLYGLQRIDYREGKYDDALRNHAFLTNLYPDSDIRPDADYLAGEVQFHRKNYSAAEQLFARLKPGDISYLYAQYTLAIINVENGREAAAVQNLTAVVSDTTDDQSDQMLQDAANLKIGHLYYESGDKLRQAVEAYARVADGSPYKDEALLGTAWSWMKVNRPQEALQSVDKLIYSMGESALIPEAYLVKGYALMLLKRYAEAVNSLEECLTAGKKAFVTDQDVEMKKVSFDSSAAAFAPVAKKIKANSLRKPTNRTLEERPAFLRDFQVFDRDSRDFFNYTLLAKSHTRFFKRKSDIVADAEYALAKATNMMKSQGAVQAREQQLMKQKQIEEEQRKIQEEIERLKQGK